MPREGLATCEKSQFQGYFTKTYSLRTEQIVPEFEMVLILPNHIPNMRRGASHAVCRGLFHLFLESAGSCGRSLIALLILLSDAEQGSLLYDISTYEAARFQRSQGRPAYAERPRQNNRGVPSGDTMRLNVAAQPAIVPTGGILPPVVLRNGCCTNHGGYQ